TTARGETNARLKPTAANIRAALKELTRTLEPTKDDTILVALAGHGIQVQVKVDGKLKEAVSLWSCRLGLYGPQPPPLQLQKALLPLGPLGSLAVSPRPITGMMNG